jgi:Mce-associated membrane protein
VSDARRLRPRIGWPPSGVALVALGVVAALLVGATAWLAVLVAGQHGRNSNRDAAVARARQIVTHYTTYDYNHVDAQFADLADEFTGPLKSKIHSDLSSILQLIKAGKGTAKGQVSDAAVLFQRGGKVSVILAVDEAVTNSVLKQGALRRYQFNVVMQKVHGHWYGTTLDLVAGGQ